MPNHAPNETGPEADIPKHLLPEQIGHWLGENPNLPATLAMVGEGLETDEAEQDTEVTGIKLIGDELWEVCMRVEPLEPGQSPLLKRAMDSAGFLHELTRAFTRTYNKKELVSFTSEPGIEPEKVGILFQREPEQDQDSGTDNRGRRTSKILKFLRPGSNPATDS